MPRGVSNKIPSKYKKGQLLVLVCPGGPKLLECKAYGKAYLDGDIQVERTDAGDMSRNLLMTPVEYSLLDATKPDAGL